MAELQQHREAGGCLVLCGLTAVYLWLSPPERLSYK